ncbi:protein SRC2 homolog [Eucalyptus grandis]|uniref:protein SRC2 homolog n=1 Tax=Eucalyptus grandis TaxID=71139 RepID=UPI00192EB755|nr:protein SRC2 homolog [Eucalyptus grandis]
MVIKSLEVTVMSAKDLHNVNVIHKMNPYVIVSLSGNHKQCTHVHKNGGTSPRWVKLLAFPVDEARADLLILMFEIMTEKTYGGDKEIGRVEVPIAELLEKQGDGKPKQISYSGPTKKSGGQGWIGGLASGFAGGLVDGLGGKLAGGLTDGLFGIVQSEAAVDEPEAAVDGPEAATNGSKVAEEK